MMITHSWCNLDRDFCVVPYGFPIPPLHFVSLHVPGDGYADVWGGGGGGGGASQVTIDVNS